MNKNKEELIKFGNNELLEKGSTDVITELFATNYVVHAEGKNYKGHGFIKRWVKQLRSAIPDIRVLKEEFQVQTDDTLVWQRTLSGTHIEEVWGIRPTKQKVEWREMVISRFDDKKIIEEWVVSELLGELLSKPPRT
ncbi:ester cyclase [Desulfobacterales bacterium HSG17]|nr:ester cyclase [Desulfobacterales bacterium HSG17]